MSTPDSTPAIEFVGVSKRFGSEGEAAIGHLDLAIDDGELVTFVGPSGCGKTTSLRLINRLIEPTSGTVMVAGRDVQSVPLETLRRDIGYVIQQVGLFPHRTVAQNIATVPKLLGWSKADIGERVEELADLVGLDRSILARHPAALSGGQQQRVGVARALAARPAVLLMDEPYSAVDPVVRAHLQDELLDLHHRVGTTIVLVTHDIDEAVRLGDRVAVFANGGRLAQYDTPDRLMASPADEFVESFLGADRQLRRLALRRLADLPLTPADDALTAATRDGAAIVLDGSLTGRNAVDEMLAAGVHTVAVRSGEDGPLLGSITLDRLSGLLRA
ncbi:MAG: ABC transporter ATP-binding protein [Acidimicrobiales bacterium]